MGKNYRLVQQNYNILLFIDIENMTEKTISFTKINLVSIPFSILTVGIIFNPFLLNIENPKEEIYKLNLFVFTILIVIHELIHAFFFE